MKIVILSLLMVFLSACGMTGELYLPQEKPVDEKAAVLIDISWPEVSARA